jgi:hypothetical protein
VGNANSSFGYNALYSNTANNNSAFGYKTLRSNTTGSKNSAFGREALFSNTIGVDNSSFGAYSLRSSTTSIENTAVGQSSGYDITTGRTNTLLGFNTGRGITTGNYNTILGANVTGLSATIANNIIIADGQGNRRINVDSSGNVGIGTISPGAKLHINGGNIYVDSGYNYTSAASSGYWASGLVSPYQVGWYESSGAMLFRTSGSEKMRIASGGNVGINTVTPSTTLEVVGTITCTTLVETSSVATKTNVKKLNSQTAKLSKLVPVSFNYKKDNKRSLGLIAEEVAQVYPELVEYDNGRPLGVNYSKLTAVLISTVNELAAEVAELKKQLNK